MTTRQPEDVIATPCITDEDGNYLNVPTTDGTPPRFKWEAPKYNRAERRNHVKATAPTVKPAKLDFKAVRLDFALKNGKPADHTPWARKYALHSDLSLYLLGKAGTGKSFEMRAMIAALQEAYGEEAVLVMAPTRVAARNVNGMTLHKFFNGYENAKKGRGYWRKRLQRTRVIFVDEISMMHCCFWGKLCTLQLSFPHLRFVLAGDIKHQIKPVKDVSETIEYECNAALHQLTEGNYLQMTL